MTIEANSYSIGRKSGEIWNSQTLLQPISFSPIGPWLLALVAAPVAKNRSLSMLATKNLAFSVKLTIIRLIIIGNYKFYRLFALWAGGIRTDLTEASLMEMNISNDGAPAASFCGSRKQRKAQPSHPFQDKNVVNKKGCNERKKRGYIEPNSREQEMILIT